MSAANPCPHCSMRHCVRCRRTAPCGQGCRPNCAAGWYSGGPVEARRQLLDTRSREAVELARRLGDPATLGWALTARFVIILGPDHLDEMVALGDEIVTVAEQAGAWEEVANGLALRFEVQLTRGEIRLAQADLERHIALAEELKLLSQSWHAAAHQAELLLLLGQFTEAAACIDQTLRRGAAAHRDEALKTAALQRLLLFMEQGSFQEGVLEELRSTLERLEAERRIRKSIPPCSPGSIANLVRSDEHKQGSTS
jgi:tetratricopeptide (TPR) repeat protein